MTRKADSLQSGSAQYNADFGEDSRIIALDAAEKPVEQTGWRRRRDSNPRDPCGPNGFQDRRFQPLTHSSASQFTRPAPTLPTPKRGAPLSLPQDLRESVEGM